MDSKHPLASKTVWANLLLALAAFFPPVQAVVQDNPQLVLSLIAVVGLVLRLVTKGKIGLEGS